MRFTTAITIDDRRVEINVPKGTKAWRLANAIFCPLGPAPTQAWFVILKSELDALDLNAAHTVEWSQKTTMDDGSDPTTVVTEFKGLYIVKAERLLHGGQNDSNALYLVEFSDARWLAAQNSATGPIRANPRSYANSASYLTGSDLDNYRTWENLVSSLWSDCGTLGSYPGLPGGLPIDSVPENTFLIGLNAWRALTAVLEQLDCAVEPNPSAGTFSIVQLGAAQTIAAATESLKWNAQPLTVNNRSAAMLRVHFFYHHKNYGQERDAELNNNIVVIGASDVIDLATGISGSSGRRFLWDDMPIVIGENGNQTNSAATTQRANNRKARYVTRMSVTNQHRIHWGIVSSFLPGGQIRATLWRNWNDGEESPFGGTVTEFVCGPELINSFKATDSGAAWLDDELASPEREAYAPPDYSRHTFPNFPRLPNIVQVWHDEAYAGDTVEATATYGLHKGLVKRWTNNAMATLDPCWILFVDSYDTKHGNLQATQGEYYGPARLSGITTEDGETLPVYTVRKGGSGESSAMVYFMAAEDREESSETFNAHFVSAFSETTPTLDGDGNFEVWDGNFFFERVMEGGAGIASFNATENRWDVIVCQQRCFYARATVNTPGGFSENAAPVPIESFSPLSPSPYSLYPNPLPTEANNPYKHKGQNGDTVLLFWDFTHEWAIVDVVKKTIKVSYGPLRMNSARTKLQSKQVNIAVEYQDDASDEARWTDLIDLKTC